MPKNEKVVDALDNFTKSFRTLLNAAEKNPEILAPLLTERQGNPITLGPRVISAGDWSKKMVDRASAAASDWETRVQRPRKNPIEAAIAADGKRKDRLNEAERVGKWAKAMAKVDETIMYDIIRKRGAAAFRSGIVDRTAKVEKRIGEIQPMVAALAASIDALPDKTDADREKRLLAARKGMIEIGKQRVGIKE